MACCKQVVTTCGDADLQFTSRGCCCRVAEKNASDLPVLNPADRGSENVTRDKFESNPVIWVNSTHRTHQNEISTDSEILHHPKFCTANQTIYDFVASYLI